MQRMEREGEYSGQRTDLGEGKIAGRDACATSLRHQAFGVTARPGVREIPGYRSRSEEYSHSVMRSSMRVWRVCSSRWTWSKYSH